MVDPGSWVQMDANTQDSMSIHITTLMMGIGGHWCLHIGLVAIKLDCGIKYRLELKKAVGHW